MATQYIEVVNLTSNAGDLVKKVVIEGAGPMANKGQVVKINWGVQVRGQGTYDSSEKRGTPMTLKVGTGEVVDGLDMALLTMKLSEKCELIVAPKYAYGAFGSPPHVPADSTLVFLVELIQIGDRKPFDFKKKEEKNVQKPKKNEKVLIENAMKLKDLGNAKFKEGSLHEAENFYRDGVDHMSHVKKTQDEETTKLRLALLQNLSNMLNK